MTVEEMTLKISTLESRLEMLESLIPAIQDNEQDIWGFGLVKAYFEIKLEYDQGKITV